MPNQNKWYQQTWIKITGFVAGVSVVGTLGTGLVNTVNHWNFYQALPDRLDEIENSIDSLYKGDLKEFSLLDSFIARKKETFAVGFRVKKSIDEHSGEPRFIKQYRDWKGRLNNVYLDYELTEFYGMEYYFYYDKDTGDKKYCW
jgi:hypothetical protein